MGKATFDHTLKLTPEQRAAEEERARGLRLFGESLGLNGIAERLKAQAASQAPTRKRKRAAGGGAKRRLSDDTIESGKSLMRAELHLDPGWATNLQACCVMVKDQLKLTCHWHTIATWIVRPALIEREAALSAQTEGPFEK